MSDLSVRFPVNPLQPGGYSVLDSSALVDANSRAGAPVVAVVGDARGGAPNVAQFFTDQQALRSILRAGAMYDCARMALAAGAARVCVVRAGASILQSTKVLAGATSNPVTLTAKDYGVWTNQIKVTVQANNVVTISYVDVNGVTFTEVFNGGVSATAQQLVDMINGSTPGVAGSAYVTAAVTAGTMPLTVAGQAAMTGGSDGSALDASAWTVGLQALEAQDVQLVEVATGDSTIHAQVLAHCNAMSDARVRKERTSVVGALAAETVSQQVTRAAAIRSPRIQLVYPGFTFTDDQGNVVNYAAFYLASFVAGLHAALPDPATSLTHARLTGAIDLEFKLSTIAGGEVDQLLAAGVSPATLAPRPGASAFWLADSLSTYITDPDFRDFHKIRTADEAAKRLRVRLEDKFVGGKTLVGTRQEILQETISELSDQVTQELIVSYKQPTVKKGPDAKSTLVTAPIELPETQKYILITVALQPPGSST